MSEPKPSLEAIRNNLSPLLAALGLDLDPERAAALVAAIRAAWEDETLEGVMFPRRPMSITRDD